MQMSTVQQRGRVMFPEFTGERIYMRGFTKAGGLPPDLRRWQDTVDAMLDGVDANGPIFLMVDQARVKAASIHRRPGLHVDGYWQPALKAHGGGGGGEHGGHHRAVPVPLGQNVPDGDHLHRKHEQHFHSGHDAEGLILASNVLGCVAYAGLFDGQPGDGGDCAHIDVSALLRVDMEPGRVWAGHTLHMLHEAIPVRCDCLRTVVRLNVRGWYPSHGHV